MGAAAARGRVNVVSLPSLIRHECVPIASVHSFRERAQARTDTAVRIRGLPPRPGAGRPRRRGRPRHAGADADRLRQVADVPARRDAAADADARALAADRADEGPGRQAAARGCGAVDADQLLAQRRRGSGPAARSVGRALPDALRGAGAAAAAQLPRGDRRNRRRPRRDRRGPLREHVGARLPARLPLHPARARRTGKAGDPGDDRDRYAGHRAGDRDRARPGARDRANERRPPEPALRRRARRRRGGAAANARPPPARAARRLGDRLRALPPQLRDPGPHVARARPRGRPLPRRPGAGRALGGAGGVHRGPHPDRRRDDGVRDGDRQARHPPRRALQLSGVARELRPDGRPGRARRPRVRHAPAREPRRLAAAAPVRALRHSDRRRPPLRLRAATRPRARSRRRSSAQRAGSARTGGNARAGRARPPRLRRRPGDADRGAGATGRRGRANRPAARALRAGGAGARRPARPLRGVQGLPAPAGGRALRRNARRGLRDVRRLLAARVAAVEEAATAPLPDDVSGAIHGAVLGPALAARADGPRGDAARVDERTPLRAALAPLRPARLRHSGRGQALDPAARGRGRARGVRERRRLPAAAGGARSQRCRESARLRRQGLPTRACSSACGRGGSSARGSTRCRPTSSSTTQRSASSRPRSRRPSSISPP